MSRCNVTRSSLDKYDSDVYGTPLELVEDVVIPPSALDAAPPESCPIDDQREPWIRPPPVQAVSKGKWSKWFKVQGKDGMPSVC